MRATGHAATLTTLILPLVLAGCQGQQCRTAPRSENAFVDRYRTAHSHKDVAAVMDMYWWQDTPTRIRQSVRESHTADLDEGLTGVRLIPPQGQATSPVVVGNTTYRPTLEIVRQLEVQLGAGDSAYTTLLAVGKRNGAYYFVGTEVVVDTDQAEDLFPGPATLNITSYGFTTVVTLNGEENAPVTDSSRGATCRLRRGENRITVATSRRPDTNLEELSVIIYAAPGAGQTGSATRVFAYEPAEVLPRYEGSFSVNGG